MQQEIEAKFINVDHDAVRKAIEAAGGECEMPMRVMRRAVFHNPELITKNAFVRVRDEGDKVTFTYKQFDDEDSIHGVKEIETSLGDFDTAVSILEQTGLSKDSYQETKRETWRLGDVEIMLDEWPWIEPFIEIEGPSEETVRMTAEKLGYVWKDAVFGGVAAVYVRKYEHMGDDAPEIINRRIPIIRFEDPLPEIIVKGIET
jgi:adenylate cyclase, class 2